MLNGRVWDPTLDRLRVPVTYLGLSLPTDFVFFTLRYRGRLGPLLPAWCAPAEMRRTSRAAHLHLVPAAG